MVLFLYEPEHTVKFSSVHQCTFKYSFYTNHLRLSLCCHYNKIVPKGLQLKSRINIERRKKMLQRAGKLLLQELIHINHIICVRLKNSIKQLKGKSLESITPGESHLVGKIYQNSHKKFFDLTKKRHIQKFDELISKNKVLQSATHCGKRVRIRSYSVQMRENAGKRRTRITPNTATFYAATNTTDKKKQVINMYFR